MTEIIRLVICILICLGMFIYSMIPVWNYIQDYLKNRNPFKHGWQPMEIFPLQCSICSRWRRDEEVHPGKGKVWDIIPPVWHCINGVTYCPECLKTKEAKKPHCKTCHCEGKVNQINN